MERHDAVLTFVELFEPLVVCFTECVHLDKETATSAEMLLSSLGRSEFIVATASMNQVLSVTKPLSVNLQTVGIDMMKAMQLVGNIIECLEEKRSSDESFDVVWTQSSTMANIIGTDLKQPRQVARQRYRVNIDCDSDQEYFKRSVYIPFLDHVISELRERFSVHQQRIVNLCVLIPKCITSYSFTNF